MCGRFAFFLPHAALQEIFTLEGEIPKLPARYNIAPSTEVLALLAAKSGSSAARAVRAQWGLQGPKGGLIINARAETLTQRPTFRPLLATGRCIIPASGYYEWLPQAGGKQPYYIYPKGDPQLLALAGLYRLEQQAEGGARVLRCCIITQAARGETAFVHDRMPLCLPQAAWTDWLGNSAEAALQGSLGEAALRCHRVSTLVSSPRNEGASLIEPQAAPTG